MKVSREQVAANRRQILDAARKLFAMHGFEAVTIAEIMKAAGLTHGGFYGHFRSKDDLVAQACAHAVGGQGRPPGQSLVDYAQGYLTAEHRDDRASGCIYAAIGGEAVRQSTQARTALTDGLERMIGRFSGAGPDGAANTERETALAALSAMVGGLVLSRLVTDPGLSDELLSATRQDLARRLDEKSAG